MEEFDDLVQKPDGDGVLDLSHRAWVTLDDTLWEFADSLLYLNASFNNISSISNGIGELTMLREIDLGSNQLEELPPEIGKCARLKKLKCNHNRLRTLPEEIKGCTLLEEIIASENELLTIPASLGKLDMLQTLKLQNNKLKELPPALGDCLQLEIVDVSFNDDLKMIPPKLRSDAEIIKWLCQKEKAFRAKIGEMEEITTELEELSRINDGEKVQLQDRVNDAEKKVAEMEAKQPTVVEAIVAKKTQFSQFCAIQ